MFSFDPIADIDLDYFEYQLRQGSTSGSLVNSVLSTDGTTQISGTNKANVFTVSVANSNSSTTTSYYGRVRTVSTSGARGSWSTYDGSGDTPLIASQYIQSLTADKIASGTIASKEITLSGTNAVIQSLSYQQNPNNGWFIKGDGIFQFGGAQGITYSGNKVYFGTDVLISGSATVGSLSVGTSPSILEINSSVPGLSIGTNGYNYWKTNGTFRVGSASKYLLFDGNNGLQISAELVGANGTFTGALNGGTISIGSGNAIFKADSNGIYLGNATFASAPFRVNTSGSLVASSGTVGGWSLSGSAITAGTIVADNSYGQYIDLNSSSTIVAYRKDFNFGIGEYWTKIDINNTRPGITVRGTANSSDLSSYMTSSVVYAGLYHESATNLWVGSQYGYKGRGTHTYLGGDSDSASTGTMRVVNGASLYGQGTGGASTLDVLVNSNGTLVAPSSSIRFKENVNNLNIDYKKVLAIQPVTFFYKDDSEIPEGAQRAIEYGVIAEQVEEAGVPELVNYKDGLPFSVPYSKMPVFLLEVCRKQEEKIEQLLSRVDELESRLV